MPVHDEKNGIVGVMKQPFEKIDENTGIDGALNRHEAHLPPRRNCGYDVHAETCARSLNHRGLADGGPGRACVEVGSHSGLVTEEYPSVLSPGLAANMRILFVDPLLDFVRALLIRSPERFLRAQTELIQQAADRRFAKRYPELPFDQRRDHQAVPQRKLEPESVTN